MTDIVCDVVRIQGDGRATQQSFSDHHVFRHIFSLKHTTAIPVMIETGKSGREKKVSALSISPFLVSSLYPKDAGSGRRGGPARPIR